MSWGDILSKVGQDTLGGLSGAGVDYARKELGVYAPATRAPVVVDQDNAGPPVVAGARSAAVVAVPGSSFWSENISVFGVPVNRALLFGSVGLLGVAGVVWLARN